MARTKKVFSSHQQLAHVWAQQTQKEGRGSSMFFNGADIYSYGYHYLAAKIHKDKKQKSFALVRSDTYSPTTSKHLSNIRGALGGLMPYFLITGAKGISNPLDASKELDALARDEIKKVMRKVNVSSQDEIKWAIERITDKFSDANELRELLGKKSIKPIDSEMKKVKAHLKKRLARFVELNNSPEKIAKREAEAKLKLERQAQIERKEIENIEKFKNGESVYLNSLDHELLQVKGDIVRTSRGAEVPLNEAVKLYRAIKQGIQVIGERVGEFTIDSITSLDSDKEIKIGCHSILLSEADRVLGTKLALV